MPIYEFQCEITNEIKEVFLPISEYNTTLIECPIHTKWCDKQLEKGFRRDQINYHSAVKVWSRPAKMELGKPTKVMVNGETGEKQVMMGTYDTAPRGWNIEELKSSIDRTRFENEQNKRFAQADEEYNVRAELQRHEVRKAMREKNNAEMTQICAESDNPTAARELMQLAMNRPIKPLQPRRTQFKLDINHSDKSNLNDIK